MLCGQRQPESWIPVTEMLTKSLSVKDVQYGILATLSNKTFGHGGLKGRGTQFLHDHKTRCEMKCKIFNICQ